MAKGVLVVWTSPVATDRDAEFNRWYDEVHLPEVLEVPGVVSASRHRVAGPVPAEGPLGQPYLALYSLEAPDLEATVAEINRRSDDGRFAMSDALGPNPVVALYEDCG